MASLPVLLLACSDYDLKERPPGNGGADAGPSILVSPLQIAFPSLSVLDGETATETITITNVGNETLELPKAWLTGDPESYSVSDLQVGTLAPKASTTLEATFHPPHTLGTSSVVEIESNDPHTPLVEVRLMGDGLAPDLQVTPTVLDMGTVLPGCSADQDVLFENVGNDDLTISDLTLSTGSKDVTWESFERDVDALPWVLPPNKRIRGHIHYAPLEVGEDHAQLLVSSNDPAEPVATTDITALAGSTIVEDVYEQPEGPEADLLFVIDDSSSMADEQYSLAANGEALIGILDAGDTDWHIAAITTSTPTFRGEVLTQATADVQAKFVDQITPGTNGAHHEKGIEMAYWSLQPGGAAGPGGDFLRDGAKLVLVFVSDEEEQSKVIEPEDAADYFLSLQDPGRVVAHSVVALPEDGCFKETYGLRYAELTSLVGGSRFSVCGNWSEIADDVANSAAVHLERFGLSQIPHPETIEAWVDGVPQSAWSYDEGTNDVVFDPASIPKAGAIIVIDYEMGTCEQ